VPEWDVDFGELTALGRLATRNAPCLLSIRPRQEPHRELAIKRPSEQKRRDRSE
jgi:hypothetical protein